MALKRFSLLTLPLAVASLALAACGGGDDSNSSSGDDRAKFREAALDYAQCMREHGVDMPDPEPGGGLMLEARPGSEAKNSRAQEACQKHLEGARPPELSAGDEREFRERALAHARCMREHGIDMPDPTFQGGGRVRMRLPEGVNPQDPRFEDAQRACGQLGPKPGE